MDQTSLETMVVALLMEVEALREAMIEESKARGIAPKDSSYGRAYLNTGLLTHNAVGPSSGTDKLRRRFFLIRTPADDIDLREALMLMRLGFSPNEIGAYADEAERLEMLT
jgi:hypothetical protein